MARHYFLFGPKPEQTQSYNSLQKLAYTSAIILAALAVFTGTVLYKPAQLSSVAWTLGGFGTVRFLHFAAMVGLVSFIPGHLIMVAIHGWSNFNSMLIGWRKNPGHLGLAPEVEPEPDLLAGGEAPEVEVTGVVRQAEIEPTMEPDGYNSKV